MPASTTALASDFPDWLSPILVKELRQGLKARLFVGVFILLQVAMIILLGLELVNVENQSNTRTDGFDFCFWLATAVSFIALAPVRGLTTLSEEQKINTLDLVQLSHLGSLRMVWGKWLALAVQTFLLATTILPYVVLRYFISKINVFDEISVLVIFLVVSLVLTALTVTLSTSTLLVRCLVLAALFPVLAYLLRFVEMMHTSFGTSGEPFAFFFGTWLQTLLSVFVFAAYTFYFLEIAAARIAPASENHARIKRGVCHTIQFLLIILGLTAQREAGRFFFVAFIPLIFWSIVEALCEPTSHLPCIYQPFYSRSSFRRLLGKVYLPGWASGVVYAVVSVFLFILCALVISPQVNDLLELVFIATLLLTGFINPLLFLLAFRPRQNRMWYYVLAVLLHGIIFLISAVSGTFNPTRHTMPGWLAAFPTAILFGMMFEALNTETMKSVAVPFFLCAIIYGSIHTYFVKREFRRMRGFAVADHVLEDAPVDAPQTPPEQPTLRVPDLLE